MSHEEIIQNIHDMAVTCTNNITFLVNFLLVAFVVWLVFTLVKHLSIYF